MQVIGVQFRLSVHAMLCTSREKAQHIICCKLQGYSTLKPDIRVFFPFAFFLVVNSNLVISLTRYYLNKTSRVERAHFFNRAREAWSSSF